VGPQREIDHRGHGESAFGGQTHEETPVRLAAMRRLESASVRQHPPGF